MTQQLQCAMPPKRPSYEDLERENERLREEVGGLKNQLEEMRHELREAMEDLNRACNL